MNHEINRSYDQAKHERVLKFTDILIVYESSNFCVVSRPYHDVCVCLIGGDKYVQVCYK